MKSVSILISNYNSYDVLRLCIESILQRTDYPNYEVIVHDDESPNGVDIKYLEKMEGWIRLIRGTNRKRWAEDFASRMPPIHPAPYWHGCALNVLLHEICHTDLAVLMDCDVFVKEPNWLSEMVKAVDDDTLIVAHCVHPRAVVEWPSGTPGKTQIYYVPGVYRISFAMLNMAAYRDEMQVDWRGGFGDIRDEPYKSLLGSLESERRRTFPDIDDTCISLDPGSPLWMKMQTDNPRQYKAKPLPPGMESKFHHFEQVSCRGTGRMDWRNDEQFIGLRPAEQAFYIKQMDLIKSELAKLE